MYKKQLKLQKMICLLCIVAAVLSFVYALGMVTDLHDALVKTMRNPEKPDQTSVTGSRIYYDIQDFNKLFVNASLVLVLLSCFLFLTNTHSRRKYYFSNYFAVGIYSAATVGVGIWANQQIRAYAVQYMTTINFEELKAYSEMWDTPYLDNTNLLDFHTVVLVLGILSAAVLLGNVVWKVILMRNEKKLIEAGEEASV